MLGFEKKYKNVVDFSYCHPLFGTIRYKGILIALNGFLLVKIFEKDGKTTRNTLTRRDAPVVSQFELSNIELHNFINGDMEIGLQLAQAVHDAKKLAPAAQ